MLKPSRCCNTISSKHFINKQTITDGVYITIFCYLILYSIFNTLYLNKVPAGESHQSDSYHIENVAVKLVNCSFSISSQYERTPRYICYFLLVVVVIIRNHEWLAAGAAASVLTYSGIAAIHMILLFATNNKLNYPKAKSHCEFLPIPGASSPFVACTGAYEPDILVAFTVVSSVMFGALPVAAWSTTFRTYTNKAILIFWLLLPGVGHSCWTLTISNPNFHFQICPKSSIEPLPMANFQAPLLDQSWRESFYYLVLTAQKSSQTPANGLSPVCIYSCFATGGYIGRKPQDISVGHLREGPLDANNNRRDVITFWWLYTLLVFVTLFTTEKKGRLPKWVHKPLFSIEYPQQPLVSRWKTKRITRITNKGIEYSITTNSSEYNTSVKIHITVLKVVQVLTQLIAIAAFCGNIVIMEVQNAQEWDFLSQEHFAAVGQWGNLAVVLLVLVAAGVSRVWARKGAKSAIVEEGTEGLEKEGWNWRVGYAS